MQRYGNQATIFASARACSGVQRSGTSSNAWLEVDCAAIAHWQGLTRDAGTTTVPNNAFSRRVRVSFSGRRLRECARRRSALYSATRP